jgi:hypothetical protein
VLVLQVANSGQSSERADVAPRERKVSREEQERIDQRREVREAMTMSVGNFRATRSAQMSTWHAFCVFPGAIPPPWIVRAVFAVAMLVIPITYAAVPTCGYYSCFQAKAAEAKVMNSQMEALKKERVAQAEARFVFPSV